MVLVGKKVNNINELMFPVEETKVAFQNAAIDSKTNFDLTKEYKAIVRSDNKQLISIIPKTTKLVKNESLIEPALKIINEVGFKWQINPESYFLDNKMKLVIGFPELKLKDDSPDGQMATMHLFNSYDTSNAIKALFGAFRLVCSNGMIIGETLGKYYHKHTKGFNEIIFRNNLLNMYKKLPEINERISILQSLEITDEVINKTEELGKKVHTFVKDHKDSHSAATDYEPVRNQLQLLNLLTYYVSHNVALHRREVYQNQISKMFKV